MAGTAFPSTAIPPASSMPPIPPNRSQSPHRSHSRKPYDHHPCKDTGVSPTARLAASPAPSHGPLSPGPANMASGTSRISTSTSSTHSQSLSNPLCANGAHEAIQAPCPKLPIDVHTVTPPHIYFTSLSNPVDFVEAQQLPVPQPATYAQVVPQQQHFGSESLHQLSSQYLPQPQLQSPAMFNQAHHFTVTGTFIDGNVTYNNAASNEFMEKLLKETIHGAAYNSSARDPPPRCHPGTRLAILDRCLDFIRNCSEAKKMRWVVGSAGVGKSAIMQSVTESPDLQVNYHASVFFSINGRNDGAKAISTISYQFAAKCEPYRQVIAREITCDPALLQSSMADQFKRLIVEPFIHDPLLKSVGRVLIIIDGLDECKDPRTQQDFLRLISNFCATYPTSPLVWLIASRPEPHITSFFNRHEVIPVYEKEEIQVDSNEARADVERFLRHEFDEIKMGSDSLDPKWPEERDIWKLANAAGGLFAYATTVVRYIGDWRTGNPVSSLSDVLHVIDNHSMFDLSGDEHPMALLDALYTRILSNVPRKTMINTRKLLLALSSDWDDALSGTGNFIVLCNWLGMTPDEAYAALHHLRSVLDVPRRDKADQDNTEPFHKSFIDYVSDSTRSGFSPDIQSEARQLATQCATRILTEAPDGVFVPEDSIFRYGPLALASRVGDSEISLTWSADGTSGWSDITTRSEVYKLAIGEVVGQIKRGDSIFDSELCVHRLTAQFEAYDSDFPLEAFRDWVFAEPRYSDFMISGVIKQVPLRSVDLSRLVLYVPVKLRYRNPATTATNSFDLCPSSCRARHERIDKWTEGKIPGWMTTFLPFCCIVCNSRLQDQLRSWKTHSPDHTVLVLFTSTTMHCVEVRFVDPEDGVSEWTYWFWFELKR